MSTDAVSLQFGPYRLHPVQGLTEGHREIRLTPKSLAVLYTLAQRSGQIVTKEELFDAAWPARSVSDAALSSCISELRRALDDDARKPHYIETVHRRGFRFLPPCGEVARDKRNSAPDVASLTDFEHELDALGAQLSDVRRGSGHVVAVLGDDPGCNSALVDVFVARATEKSVWQVGRGACEELSGRADPYRPLLDAITSLCLQPGGSQIVSQLRLHAPTWLAELTPVLQPGELAAQRLRTAGVTTSRVHRELNSAIAAIATRRPLLLVLEDLQWCDRPTLDWLAGLEQPLAAPVLVLATHTSDARIEIETTITLASDDSSDVGDPFGRLADRERRVLQAAGIVGLRFSDAEVAAALDLPRAAVVESLAGLVAAGDLVHDAGAEWLTDEASAERYRFSSRALRRRLLDALPVQQERCLHRRIAHGVKTALGEPASDRSPELAVRFERAYDIEGAVHSCHDAAIVCRRRGAHSIAHAHLRRALALLPGMPDSADRNAWDALLHAAVGGELAAEQGVGGVEVDDCFERALALSEEIPVSRRLFTVLWRIWVFHFHRGPLTKAHDTAVRVFEVARALDDPALQLSAHHAFWGTALAQGDVRRVLRHTRAGIALCGNGLDGALAITEGCTLHDSHVSNHPAAVCAGFCGAWAEALAGHPAHAKQAVDVAVAHARDFGHPFTLALSLVQSAGALAASGDAVNARRYSCEGAAIAREHGFAVLDAWSGVYEGWAVARLGDTREGVRAMHKGLDASRGTGLWLFRPFQLALAAEVELENGMHDAAARSLDEAFTIAAGVGDRLAAARLHWLRGELTLATATTVEHLVEAEHNLRASLDIANATGTEEVRARVAKSLARLDRVDGGLREGLAGHSRAANRDPTGRV